MSKILELIDSLPNSQDRVAKLNDIRICLVSTNALELKGAVANVSFNVIFECLQTNNKAELEACCIVLDGLLSACEAVTLIHQFHDYLLQGLCHDEDSVKSLCLKQVQSACSSCPQQVAAYSNIVCQLIKLIGQKEMSIAKLAMDIIIVLGCTAEGLECLMQGTAFLEIQDVMEQNDEIRYRVYQVLIDIAKASKENLDRCETSGLLQRLLNEVHSGDILLQLNSIELLTILACNQHGLVYLDRKGVITKLDEMLQAADTNPLASFLMPGLLKFFSHISQQQPEELSGRLQPFINTMFSHVQSPDPSIKIVAIESLGHVGALPDGKKALEKQGNAMVAACSHVGETLKNSQSDVRVRVMDAVSSLLHLRVSDQTEELLSITQSWYSSLAANTLDFVMKQCQQPFLQLRCSALTFLRILANQPWGQHNLNNFAAFHEYILNRSTETAKQGKDGKFEIVKTLVESPTAMDIFGRVYFLKLREYYNDGAYFVKAESSVAFEGDA